MTLGVFRGTPRRVKLFNLPLVSATVLSLLALAGCSAAPPALVAGDGAESTSDALLFCPTYKIDFTRKTGCQNDGAVEFCVPKDGLALQARIKALDSDITFVGSRGRAQCDIATELLGMYPVDREPGGDCTASGALTRHAWSDVCLIASECKVRRVVPTFYE